MEDRRTGRLHARIFAGVLMVLMCFVYGKGQSEAQKVFDVVPEAMRARLVERLSNYTEYQRSKQYEKLYDLFSESTIKNLFRGQSKTEFINAWQKGDNEGTSRRLIEFIPGHTEKIAGESTDIYVIYGRAKFCEGGKVVEKKRTAIEAHLQNGDWYFSAPADVVID